MELARLHPEAVGVRDSKDPEGPRLALGPSVARCLADAIRAGQYDTH
ncbi:DUF397 domain-containing protein [Actinomadura harenae]